MAVQGKRAQITGSGTPSVPTRRTGATRRLRPLWVLDRVVLALYDGSVGVVNNVD